MSRLVVFLSIYFAVYGSVHLYVLIKLRRAYYLNGLPYVFLVLLLIFLMLAPIQSRLIETQGFGMLSLALAWIGFVWMGFIFLFLCFALLLDGYQLLVTFGQRLTGSELTHLMLSRRQYVSLAGIAALCLAGYGAVEANQIRLERLTVASEKIPAAQGRLRIVQISDLHIGPMFYPGRLASIIAAIESAQPDILVSTGDLVDGRVYNAPTIAAALSGIAAPLGKFAITGNHEFYSHLEQALRFTQAAGFTVLRDRTLVVGKHLAIVGVEDSTSQTTQASVSERELLERIKGNRFALLLKHRPTIDSGSRGLFDLQLSGHTHRGQIFPFTLFIKLRYPMDGLHRLQSGGWLYVSRGTGTWGPPMRLLNPPEVTIIDLIPGRAATLKTKS